MSKELIVAGGIVAACIGLSVIAFVKPAEKAPAVTDPEPITAKIDPPVNPEHWGNPGNDSGTNAGNDPFNFPKPDAAPLPPPDAIPEPPIVRMQPPEIVPPPPATPTEKTHVVAKGDTLGDISRQYYGTTKYWEKIKDANKVDPNGLLVGQKLIIPAIAVDTSTGTGTPTDGSSSAGLYVVKKGDSYYRIAEHELGDPSRAKDIETLNGIGPEDLRVGQKLKLPSRAATGSPAPTPVSGSSSTSAPAGSRTHTVKSDEYLIDISEKYYGTTAKWKIIADANPGINPNKLMVGQKLVIPDAGGSSSHSTSGGSETATDGGDTYTIKSGDTLEKVAQKLLGDGSKWQDIAKLNPGVDPTRLMVGQKITVPKGAAKPAPPAPLPAPTPTLRLPAPTPAPAPVFPTRSSDTPFGETAPMFTPTPAPAPLTPPAPADPWSSLPPAPAPAPTAAPAPLNDDPWADFPGSR